MAGERLRLPATGSCRKPVAVHGRTPFEPRFDGTDRWLQRTFVVSDLAPSAAERRGRVIVTQFGA